MKANVRMGVGVLLTHMTAGGPGRSLLLKRAAGQWEIPGGKLDPGENPRQAALREFHEETGVALKDNELDLAYQFTSTDPDGTLFLFQVYEASRWDEPEPIVVDGITHVEGQYLSWAEMRKLDVAPILKAIFEEERKHLARHAVRELPYTGRHENSDGSPRPETTLFKAWTMEDDGDPSIWYFRCKHRPGVDAEAAMRAAFAAWAATPEGAGFVEENGCNWGDAAFIPDEVLKAHGILSFDLADEPADRVVKVEHNEELFERTEG